MALSTKSGNFALNTSTGNQAVTGVGFLPEIVLFFISNQTADGIGTHFQFGFGVGISSTERACVTNNDEDAQTTSDNSRSQRSDKCIRLSNLGATSILFDADLVSLDADGFTVNVTTAPASAFRVGYLALGGTDLTNVALGNFAGSGLTGNQAITGVGFQPDAVLIFGTEDTLVDDNSTNGLFFLGFAVSATERACISISADNNEATSNVNRLQFTDACLVGLSVGGSVDAEADFVSNDADGFTINWSDSRDKAYHFLCLKGAQYAVGSLDTQTSTGNFSETGVGFQGDAGIFASFCNVTDASPVGGLEMSLGVATSSTERFIIGGTSEDGQATTDCDNYSDDGLIYQNYDFAQALEGSIDFVSWDADGFTLDQVDADPTAGNEMIYFVIGADAAAAAGPVYPGRNHPSKNLLLRL